MVNEWDLTLGTSLLMRCISWEWPCWAWWHSRSTPSTFDPPGSTKAGRTRSRRWSTERWCTADKEECCFQARFSDLLSKDFWRGKAMLQNRWLQRWPCSADWSTCFSRSKIFVGDLETVGGCARCSGSIFLFKINHFTKDVERDAH